VSDRPTEHFELYDQDLANHYPERVSAIRERCPVAWSDAAWSEKDSGFWLLSAFDDVTSAAQEWRTFSSANGAAPIQFDLSVFRMIPLETDPPVHRNVRRVLTPFFAAEASRNAEQGIAGFVGSLLDGCVAKGTTDFLLDFCVPLPSRVFFEIFLGEDPEQIAEMIDIIDTLFATPEAAAERAPDILGWAAAVLEGRRADGRKDDVLGAVAHAGNEPDFTLDEFERMQIVMMLIMAGMETTASGLGNVAYRLATDDDLRVSLRGIDEPAMDRAVDEFLRFDSPVPAAGRTLTTDTELGGCPMHAGERVTLSWTAANRDPKAFAGDPDVLDVLRPDANKHLAFGAGQHRCLGLHLARRELKAAIRGIVELETFELVPGTEITYRAGPATCPAALPIRCAR
jgi:cytochrome P450